MESFEHSGIKGMHWGVRRYQNEDGTLTEEGKRRYNPNYSAQQRKRDERYYGKRAVDRINKRMNKGESISSARHAEVLRKDRIESGKAVARTVAKGALVIAGSTAVVYAMQKKGFSDSFANTVGEESIKVGRQVINALLRGR